MKDRVLLIPAVVLLLCAVVIMTSVVAIVGVVLGWWALFGLEHPERERARLEKTYDHELREYQALCEAQSQRSHEKIASALAALPDDAPIPRTWTWREAMNDIPSGYDGELIQNLSLGYFGNPDNMSGAHCGILRAKLESLGQYSERLTPLEMEFSALASDPTALRVRFEEYLDDLRVLNELDYAITHGIADPELHKNPQNSDDGYYDRCKVSFVLLAARALAAGLRGDPERASQTILGLYNLSDHLRDTGSVWPARTVLYQADRIVSLLTPHVDWTSGQIAAIESALAFSPDDFAKLLKMEAARQSPSFEELRQELAFDMQRLRLRRFSSASQLAQTFEDSPEAFASRLQELSDADRDEFSIVDAIFRGVGNVVADIFADDIPRIAELWVDLGLRSELFQRARELEEYKVQHGDYPESLNELPSRPKPVVSYRFGQTVHFFKEEQSFRFESTGRPRPYLFWGNPDSRGCDDVGEPDGNAD